MIIFIYLIKLTQAKKVYPVLEKSLQLYLLKNWWRFEISPFGRDDICSVNVISSEARNLLHSLRHRFLRSYLQLS